jgi:uncharacterized protein YndB with AHSA1/START domain
MTGFGMITLEGGFHTIRFERRLEFAPDEVWAALTEPDSLREWLAEATVVPGREGEISIDFGEGGHETGRITAWDPPCVLAYEWNFVGEEPSHVRWELAALDNGRSTHVTLEHTRLESSAASGYGAGWHAHLDQLQGYLAGSVPDWDERYSELHPHYAKLAAPTA